MEAHTTVNAKLAKAAKILFVIVLQTSDFRLQTYLTAAAASFRHHGLP